MQNEFVESSKDNENKMTVNETTTTVVNSDAATKKEKFEKKVQLNKQIIDFLVEKFPLCFVKEESIKPLKLGIFQDIVDNEEVLAQFSKTNLRSAIRYYTMSWKYLEAVAKGGDRIDLAGQTVGIVDEQQKTHAAEQLSEAKAKVKARFNPRKSHLNKEPKKVKSSKNSQSKFKTPRTNANSSRTTPSVLTKNDDKVHANPIAKETAKPLQENGPKKIVHQPVDASSLKIGASINVLIGQSYSQAEILEINKENVRVSLPTGLTLNVKIDNLSQ